jgi:hypothetical protein
MITKMVDLTAEFAENAEKKEPETLSVLGALKRSGRLPLEMGR